MNNNAGDLSGVTRLEVIDHTKCVNCHGSGIIHIEGQNHPFECTSCHGGGIRGREVIFFDPDKQIELSKQDDGKTLKIFISDRK